MAAEQITVKARTRPAQRPRRTGPSEERWDQETAPSYEEARDAICARLTEGEIVLASYVDRS